MRTLILIFVLVGTSVWSDAYNYQRLEEDKLSDVDKPNENLQNDNQRLQDLLHKLAQLYNIEVEEVEDFFINKNQVKFPNSTSKDEWKQEERKQLFWLFQDGKANNENLEESQNDNEDRLIVVQNKFKINIEYIKQWQRKELEHYKALVNQYSSPENLDLLEWQKNEKSRIDWLIHQNKMTREDFEQWLKDYNFKFVDLCEKYKIANEELKEYYLQEFKRLDLIFNQHQNSQIVDSYSNFLQKEEIDRLTNTVDRLQEKIESDENSFNSLEQQYKSLKNELENLTKVNNEKQATMQNQLDQLDNVIHYQNRTVQEWKRKINSDRNRFNSMKNIQQLSIKYSVDVEEIEELIKKKFQHLKNEEQKPLPEWQKSEREHLLQLAKQNSKLSILELLEEQLPAYHMYYENIANRYHISVEAIEEWIRKEAEDLENKGVIGNLKDWQKVERSRIRDMLKESYVTIEEFQEKLKRDHDRLQNLADQYETSIEEVEQWILKEGSRQIRAEALTSWQISERNWLEKLIRNENMTLIELELTIKNEENRIEQLADNNHVTIEEIEEFIRMEGERLWEIVWSSRVSNRNSEYVIPLNEDSMVEKWPYDNDSNTEDSNEKIENIEYQE